MKLPALPPPDNRTFPGGKAETHSASINFQAKKITIIGMKPLHGVMSGTRIRQKFAKKRSLHEVNEHFSRIFNAIIVPRSNPCKGLGI
jgi:hypothetical protein